jgi:phytoene desaturase
MTTVSIIGSGFGGLSLAIRLQARGFKVTIFEKNEKIGGHAYQLKKDGYTFDMGPSVITAPEIIQKIFDTAGKKMEDYLDIVRLDPYYRIYFNDKSYIDYNGDTDHMISEMSKFSKEDAANYESFMSYASKLHKAVIEDGLGGIPFTPDILVKFLPEAIRLKALMPEFGTVKSYFKHPNNQFTFSFHPLFIGGNPFNAPGVYLMIPYLEKVGGVWFSKGGMYSLVQALEKLFIELGGEIKTNSPVQEILTEGRKAVGVKVNGEERRSDLVVSNAHFAHTYMDLIPAEKRRKWTDRKIKSKDYSMSCMVIYLGVKKKYPQLKHHTLILSRRYRELIEDIFNKKILADDFSMYLHVPSLTDPDMAPEGCESIYLLIPTPNLKADFNWSEIKEQFAQKVLTYLQDEFGMEDLKENIEVMELFTPEDFRDVRNNYLGAPWSLTPSLLQSATLRPHNKSEEFDNLYIVGVSTHPGGGVPGVMLTAEATEKAILKDHQP